MPPTCLWSLETHSLAPILRNGCGLIHPSSPGKKSGVLDHSISRYDPVRKGQG